MNAATDFMDIAFKLAFIGIVMAQIMSMIRLVIGPSVGDRILALDTMVVNAIGLVVLLGIAQGTQIYFEATVETKPSMATINVASK